MTVQAIKRDLGVLVDANLKNSRKTKRRQTSYYKYTKLLLLFFTENFFIVFFMVVYKFYLFNNLCVQAILQLCLK